MSLLPLFNYIENHANKYPKVQKTLQLTASNIITHNQAESHNAELKNFLRRNIMEYYSFHILAEQHITDKQNRLNIERAAETTFTNFFKLCEQIKRFDFERILELNMSTQEIQMQNYVVDTQNSHDQEAQMVVQMNNRNIAQKLRYAQQRNYDSLLILAKIKGDMQKFRKVKRQKLTALKMKRNEQIVHLLRSFKRTERLKEEKYNYQCNRGNIATLTKLKLNLLTKYDELKKNELRILNFVRNRKGERHLYADPIYAVEPEACLLNMYPKAYNKNSCVDDILNNQRNNIKAKPVPELKSILQKNVNSKLNLLSGGTQFKQVQFLLPETKSSKLDFEETIETNGSHETNTNRALANIKDTGELQNNGICDNTHQQKFTGIEIIGCRTVNEIEASFNESETSSVELSESTEIVPGEPKIVKNLQKLKALNDFTKYLLADTVEDTNVDSTRGSNVHKYKRNITDEELFFGSESMVNVDCIANNEIMLLDLSGSELESNINDNFF